MTTRMNNNNFDMQNMLAQILASFVEQNQSNTQKQSEEQKTVTATTSIDQTIEKNENTNNQQNVKNKPSDKGRCDFNGCKKKLSLCPSKCRCGNIYCDNHRTIVDHRCMYDYKAEYAKKIIENNPKVHDNKITKI